MSDSAQAQEWLYTQLSVSRETMRELERFVTFLKYEAQHQNLISAATLGSSWMRHVVDSAQLLKLPGVRYPAAPATWLDLGTGAGFPGLIIALLSDHHITLVESRARRVEYLERAIALLGLEERVTLLGKPLEKIPTSAFDIISARAFAPLPRLFEKAERFSTDNTLWLLPKGRNAVTELHETVALPKWRDRLAFNVTPSVTNSDAGILVGTMAGQRRHSA